VGALTSCRQALQTGLARRGRANKERCQDLLAGLARAGKTGYLGWLGDGLCVTLTTEP
jgi:hypothetical protein